MEKNKSKLITGIVLVVAGVGLLFWALSGPSAKAPAVDESPASPTVEQQEAAEEESSEEAVIAEETTIVFTDEGFSPEELTVTEGTVVRVKNESSQRVQFSSDDHPTHRLNEGMNLPILAPGESDTFIAGPVGVHGFHDHINAQFVGTITVAE